LKLNAGCSLFGWWNCQCQVKWSNRKDTQKNKWYAITKKILNVPNIIPIGIFFWNRVSMILAGFSLHGFVCLHSIYTTKFAKFFFLATFPLNCRSRKKYTRQVACASYLINLIIAYYCCRDLNVVVQWAVPAYTYLVAAQCNCKLFSREQTFGIW
jgi:hypothetical protein